MGWEVLLFVPNIIGYIRIVLASVAIIFFHYPVICTILYGISVLLDGIDGYAARKLNQTSIFGAWFDVVIDNFSRGLLWCSLYKWGYLVVFLEWVTFMSTHSRGSNWKVTEEHFPTLVQLVMANGFKSPLGCYAVGSLHILPMWMYMHEMGVLSLILGVPDVFVYVGIAVFTIGRTICLSVEVFYVYHYIKHLVDCHEK
ncbi:uncharacterized protein [Haliotis asinina]|uniref:uncharacterized protein n=1 Tax=Haliotis asinina TaxID=109174 RepID=UPI003531F522